MMKKELLIENKLGLHARAAVFVWGYQSAGDAVALMAHYSFTKMARLFKAVSLAVTVKPTSRGSKAR